jgi:hypothetical protein
VVEFIENAQGMTIQTLDITGIFQNKHDMKRYA